MVEVSSVVPSDLGGLANKTLVSASWAIGLVIFSAVIILVLVVLKKRKKWFLDCYLKVPRANGEIIQIEHRKGRWDSKNGWVTIKRGFGRVNSRPVDPKKWIKGNNCVELLQLGPNDFAFIDSKCYKMLKDDKGKVHALMSINADLGKRKSWKNYTERMAKEAFTMTSFLEKHQFAISMAIMMIAMFVGFSILYAKV